MNPTLDCIAQRRSVRSFGERPVDRATADQIIQAAMRAPTAGNLMLYSIIEIADPAIKAQLAESCDHQPFIAKAPLVLLFFADYQRWFDLFVASDVPTMCAAQNKPMRCPAEGDLMLACSDALIAAQTAVIAAEALGLGSCYIGDIMEQYAFHRELLDLPQYVFPIAMLCIGYPSEAAKRRRLTTRLPQPLVHHTDRYQRLDAEGLRAFSAAQRQPSSYLEPAVNLGQHVYVRKFGAQFSYEMSRSAAEAIRRWCAEPED